MPSLASSMFSFAFSLFSVELHDSFPVHHFLSGSSQGVRAATAPRPDPKDHLNRRSIISSHGAIFLPGKMKRFCQDEGYTVNFRVSSLLNPEAFSGYGGIIISGESIKIPSKMLQWECNLQSSYMPNKIWHNTCKKSEEKAGAFCIHWSMSNVTR